MRLFLDLDMIKGRWQPWTKEGAPKENIGTGVGQWQQRNGKWMLWTGPEPPPAESLEDDTEGGQGAAEAGQALQDAKTPSVEVAEAKSPELDADAAQAKQAADLAREMGNEELAELHDQKVEEAGGVTSSEEQSQAQEQQSKEEAKVAKDTAASKKKLNTLRESVMDAESRLGSDVDRELAAKYLDSAEQAEAEGNFEEAEKLLRDAKRDLVRENIKTREAKAKDKAEKQKEAAKKKEEAAKKKKDEASQKAAEKEKAAAEKAKEASKKKADSAQKKVLDREAKMDGDVDRSGVDEYLEAAQRAVDDEDFEAAREFYEDADRELSRAEKTFKNEQAAQKEAAKQEAVAQKEAAKQEAVKQKEADKAQKQEDKEDAAFDKKQEAAAKEAAKEPRSKKTAMSAFNTGRRVGEVVATGEETPMNPVGGTVRAGVAGTAKLGHHLLKDDKKQEDKPKGHVSQSSLGKSMNSIPLAQVEEVLDDMGINPAHEEFSLQSVHRGAEHELEHTSNVKEAVQIAIDHLKEHPRYYKRLDIAMEVPLTELTKLEATRKSGLYLDLNKATNISNGSSSSAGDTDNTFQEIREYNESYARPRTGTQAVMPNDDDPDVGKEWDGTGETLDEELQEERDQDEERAKKQNLIPDTLDKSLDFKHLHDVSNLIKSIKTSRVTNAEHDFLTESGYTEEDIVKGYARIQGRDRGKFSDWLVNRMNKSINALR